MNTTITHTAPIHEATSTHSAPDALGWTRCHDPAAVVWHPDNCVHAFLDHEHACTSAYTEFVAGRAAREGGSLLEIASATALLARASHLTPEQVADRLHLGRA